MATHSNILAGKFTWTEEPGGLQSMGLQRVWHDWTSPLYIYTHTHTYHIFIHSSVDRHLGASLSWVIEKNAAMNTEVYVSFWISVFIFLDTHPRVELLDHMAVLFSVFWETSILFSVVATPIYIPTNGIQESMMYYLHTSYHGNVESQLYQRTTCNVKLTHTILKWKNI